MRYQESTISAFFIAVAFSASVEGHGHVKAPMSRNYYAHVQGTQSNQDNSSANPIYQSTPQGLNKNHGMCGVDQSPPYLDYDLWLDTRNQPMPWMSQEDYDAGQEIVVDIHLTAHHRGHFVMKGCPLGRDSSQACLDYYPLEFVQDVYYNMPKDENKPSRAYIKEGVMDYRIVWKLPDDLVGKEVLLQWMYFTANSCNPDGYHEYFGKNPGVSKAWQSTLSNCALPEDEWNHVPPPNAQGPYPAMEVFYNCIEVTVIGEPTMTPPFPPPSPRPPTDPPQVQLPPNLPPVDSGVVGTCGGGSTGNGVCPDHTMCCSQWGHCGTVATGHCESLAPCSVCGPMPEGGGDSGEPGMTPPTSPPMSSGGGSGGGYTCVAVPQSELSGGQWATTDEMCAQCAQTPPYEWWPCDAANIYLCKCGDGVAGGA